ncbi:hypothetical protein D623_10029891 [Myotis brandtii]|uniref:Uncharacterized protein n=1 Tax=Myotis brandtii TaxID=109478 RepID=S7PJJ8_MYOBR|nr:hypothetical protein D623_10029891 [Myotis brandtii]
MQTAVSTAVPAPTPPEPRSPRLYLVGGTHAVLVSFDQVRAQEHLMQVVAVAVKDLSLQL